MGAMRTFLDFDAWGEAVRGADLRLACDGVERPVWRLAMRNLGSVVVQMAHEGGGTICYGANNHGGTVLFLPLTHAGLQVANCEPLGEAALLAIPPGSDFSICVRRRAHAWCSVALPADSAAAAGRGPAHSRIVRSGVGQMRRLKNLVSRVFATPLLGDLPESGHANAAAQLIEAVHACLGTPSGSPPVQGRPRIDRAEIIRRAQTHLESVAPVRPSVRTLAAAAGVTDRTLCRAFHDTFGVSPRRYMTLMLLHRVRRALRQPGVPEKTVTQILTAHGIWEFGRFAARYRRQFGESLSDTLSHAEG